MSQQFSAAELEAYLDEALPLERTTQLEAALRSDKALRRALEAANGRRDAGVHSLGGIWRRHRLSCPERTELGNYLLGVLTDDEAEYLRFHLQVAGCRRCAASLADLEATQAAADAHQTIQRRKKYFESSVGRLPRG